MRYLKKFDNFKESAAPSTAPSPATRPGPATRPDRETPPSRPRKPMSPSKPIKRPSQNPDPKAEITEDDVVNRFFQEIKNEGGSIKDYLKK